MSSDSDEVIDLCSVSLCDLTLPTPTSNVAASPPAAASSSPTPTLDSSDEDTLDRLIDLPLPTIASRNALASASAPTAASNMVASAPPAAASSPVWFNRTEPDHHSAVNRNKATAQATYDERISLLSPTQQKNQYDPNVPSLSKQEGRADKYFRQNSPLNPGLGATEQLRELDTEQLRVLKRLQSQAAVYALGDSPLPGDVVFDTIVAPMSNLSVGMSHITGDPVSAFDWNSLLQHPPSPPPAASRKKGAYSLFTPPPSPPPAASMPRRKKGAYSLFTPPPSPPPAASMSMPTPADEVQSPESPAGLKPPPPKVNDLDQSPAGMKPPPPKNKADRKKQSASMPRGRSKSLSQKKNSKSGKERSTSLPVPKKLSDEQKASIKALITESNLDVRFRANNPLGFCIDYKRYLYKIGRNKKRFSYTIPRIGTTRDDSEYIRHVNQVAAVLNKIPKASISKEECDNALALQNIDMTGGNQTWHDKFAQLKQFYEKRGHSTICNNDATTNDVKSLLTWSRKQRQIKKRLKDTQIELLDGIQFEWTTRARPGTYDNRNEGDRAREKARRDEAATAALKEHLNRIDSSTAPQDFSMENPSQPFGMTPSAFLNSDIAITVDPTKEFGDKNRLYRDR